MAYAASVYGWLDHNPHDHATSFFFFSDFKNTARHTKGGTRPRWIENWTKLFQEETLLRTTNHMPHATYSLAPSVLGPPPTLPCDDPLVLGLAPEFCPSFLRNTKGAANGGRREESSVWAGIL